MNISFPSSISEAAGRLRTGELTPEGLLDACLARIREWEPHVRAWVRVDERGARREAERLGAMQRSGRFAGPLHGIPLGIKDIIDVAGLPTEAGSPLLADRVADVDADVVQRLRGAGAVMLGKTVTTEFAYLDPPPTGNPWNLDHTPGGSSSGSAAAVATGMCLGALGTQTGGSILRPAAYCGVAGLKPSYGRLATGGIVPLSRRLDHVGPIARTAGDLAILFRVLDGRAEDPAEHLATPPTLHRVDAFFREQADAEVRGVTERAYEQLRSAGAAIEELPLPASFASCLAMHRCIMAVDAAEAHFATYREHRKIYGRQIAQLIEEGLSTLAIDYALSLRHQAMFQRDMAAALAGGKVAMMPSTMTSAPAGRDSTGDPRFNAPWSYAGLPAVTIPCGVCPDGLPCGLQLTAGPGGDDLLLQAAAWCEAALDFRGQPPLATGMSSC